MNEFWAATAGAAIGGVATFAASWWQTRHVLKNERELTNQAANHQRVQAEMAAARETAVMLLDRLAAMRVLFGEVRYVPPMSWWRAGDRPHDPIPQPARDALRELERLDASHVHLLPPEIGDRWYALILLINEYREARVEDEDDAEAEAGVWTDALLNRAGRDTLAYLAYVQMTLVEYVRQQAIAPHVDAPVLRRPIDADDGWVLSEQFEAGT